MSARIRLACAAVAIAAALSALPAQADARVPFGFAGTMIDGPMNAPGYDPGAEMDVMVASGVESVRFAFHWIDGQPYARFADVPPSQRAAYHDVGGVPTSFARYDAMVAGAARRGLALLPNVTTTPWWAAKYPGTFGSPPIGTRSYARFTGALARRYGPRGSFWRENPSVPYRPIRTWQLWNEPNLRYSWTDRRWAPPFVRLLRAGRAAIKRVDRGARFVLAGLPYKSWRSLGAIYRQRGARALFDEVAVHPYTRPPRGLITIVERVRKVMRRNGDARKPVRITEFGWPSSKGKTDVQGIGLGTTERGQARRLRQALGLLARHRKRLRIASVYYYTWLTNDHPPTSVFYYAGLRRREPSGQVVPKPAFHTFRRTALRLRDCARKSTVATRCSRRLR